MTDDNVHNILKKMDKDLEAPSGLGAKVWGKFQERNKYRREILFWRGFSLASVSLLLGFVISGHLKVDSRGLSVANVNDPIVFHIENDLGMAFENVNMQMEIPEGVEFHTEDRQVAQQKKLNIKSAILEKGRVRLPFVVRAQRSGPKVFKIKIFDDKQNLIKDKTLTIQFLESQKTEVKKEKVI